MPTVPPIAMQEAFTDVHSFISSGKSPSTQNANGEATCTNESTAKDKDAFSDLMLLGSRSSIEDEVKKAKQFFKAAETFSFPGEQSVEPNFEKLPPLPSGKCSILDTSFKCLRELRGAKMPPDSQKNADLNSFRRPQNPSVVVSMHVLSSFSPPVSDWISPDASTAPSPTAAFLIERPMDFVVKLLSEHSDVLMTEDEKVLYPGEQQRKEFKKKVIESCFDPKKADEFGKISVENPNSLSHLLSPKTLWSHAQVAAASFDQRRFRLSLSIETLEIDKGEIEQREREREERKKAKDPTEGEGDSSTNDMVFEDEKGFTFGHRLKVETIIIQPLSLFLSRAKKTLDSIDENEKKLEAHTAKLDLSIPTQQFFVNSKEHSDHVLLRDDFSELQNESPMTQIELRKFIAEHYLIPDASEESKTLYKKGLLVFIPSSNHNCRTSFIVSPSSSSFNFLNEFLMKNSVIYSSDDYFSSPHHQLPPPTLTIPESLSAIPLFKKEALQVLFNFYGWGENIDQTLRDLKALKTEILDRRTQQFLKNPRDNKIALPAQHAFPPPPPALWFHFEKDWNPSLPLREKDPLAWWVWIIVTLVIVLVLVLVIIFVILKFFSESSLAWRMKTNWWPRLQKVFGRNSDQVMPLIKM
eukprot:GDKJ01028727.1.p1 GENE.GDKJ01028727.1~~GDKJ01028727.1.p1  ORF type:complete len:639 (+),score=179.63 GDKJ01028727.1:589-2505(+)